jgi:hypothetical protein
VLTFVIAGGKDQPIYEADFTGQKEVRSSADSTSYRARSYHHLLLTLLACSTTCAATNAVPASVCPSCVAGCCGRGHVVLEGAALEGLCQLGT